MRSITSNNEITYSELLQEILDIVKTTPNDMVLGKKIRKFSDEINEKLK